MDLDVVSGRSHQIGIVPQKPEGEIASLTQQGSHTAIDVIMIQMAGLWFRAERAAIALLGAYLIDTFARHSVLTKPVRLLARRVVAKLASRTESGGNRGISGVVLDRDCPFARGAPPETLWNPRQVPHLLAGRSSSLAVVRIALVAIAHQAVEGQSVTQRPI
jgi:hypothetical protein